MTRKHLDIGCGAVPRNPYGCDEVHGVDLATGKTDIGAFIKCANLSLEGIPHPDSSFDSISAFNFLEHVPRILVTKSGDRTRFPFVELMNEIFRVLKPGGRLYALTPAYPHPSAFQDPTHVNIITIDTWLYFCGPQTLARMYGFNGNFEMLRNEWVVERDAFSAVATFNWQARWRRERRRIKGELSHIVWEFVSHKSD